MSTVRNPKQEGSSLWDCIPQVGPCPMNCAECFYNRSGAFYVPIDKPHIPTPEEVGDGIVRFNCGHDSNIDRDLVIETAKKYKRFFFNTSIPRYDFPGPVVLTANPKEEDWTAYQLPLWGKPPTNLMYVRLRTSASNLAMINQAVRDWTAAQIPVVITFMSYYTDQPKVPLDVVTAITGPCYTWKVRHINSYFCPTENFMRWVMARYSDNRLVSMCGSLESPYCVACRNCETHYIQTMKRLRGE